MKYLITLLLFSATCLGQVGISTTTPNASLDIRSTNQAAPANTDGILIPKVDEFPSTDPTSDQDGMLVFATGAGSVAKGFYFWNQGSGWSSIEGAGDVDWYGEGTSLPPTSATQDIYTLGNVGIGVNSPNKPLAVFDPNGTPAEFAALLNDSSNADVVFTEIDGTGDGVITGNRIRIRNNGNGLHQGSYIALEGSGNGNNIGYTTSISNSGSGGQAGFLAFLSGNSTTSSQTGFEVNTVGTHDNFIYGFSVSNSVSGDGFHYGLRTTMSGPGTGNRYGTRTNFNGVGSGSHYGTYNDLSSIGSGPKYGSFNNISQSAGGDHYAVFGRALKAGANTWAGYFLGDVYIGTSTLNGYALPATDGTANQYLQTDGSGATSWVDFTTGSINDLSDGRSDNDGSDNGSSIFLGIDAGANDDQTNNQNIGIGYRSLATNTSGNRNVGVGRQTLEANTTGFGNIAVGNYNLISNTDGTYNIALGAGALGNNTTGDRNLAIGRSVLTQISTQSDNVAIGYEAMATSEGENNVAIGVSAGKGALGDNNVFIGPEAGSFNSIRSMTGSVMIGRSVGRSATRSNILLIDNTSSATPLIYGEFDTDILGFHADVAIGHDSPQAPLHIEDDGTAGSPTIVAALESATSQQPVLQFANTSTISLSAGMSIEYDGTGAAATQSLNINAVGGTSLFEFGNAGDFSIQDGDVIIQNSGDDRELRMADTAGNQDRVLVRQETTDDIYFGDVDNNGADIYFRTGGTTEVVIEDGGQVGINTLTPGYDLEVNGTAAKPGGGAWTNSSDRRLKQDITDFESGLETVIQIRPVRYRYNEHSGYDTQQSHVGVIAQEYQKAVPDAVSTFEHPKGEYLAVDTSSLTFILVNAIQEQQAQIEELKKELEALQSKGDKVEN